MASSVLQTACASPDTTQLPSHTNHTPVDQCFWINYRLVRVISIGDITGSRQIIIWLEFQNNANYDWSIYLGNMKVRVPSGEWRQCYRTCWSNILLTNICEASKRYVWSHQTHTLGPRSNATAWAIFELSKFEFDSMRQLEIQWPTPEGDLAAVLPISPGRQPERVPYVDMLSPVQGQQLAWLGSVRFQVIDLDSRPVNWTVDLDGAFRLEGRADPRSDPCPIMVEASLGDRRLSPGAHHLVVGATDGRVSETVSVDFVLQPMAPELELKWTINTSSIIPGKYFGAGWQGCQTVLDIDQDGTNEIIFGTRRGDKRLWCFDANRKLEWIYPPMDQDPLPGDPTSKVSLIDVNNDGRYELCCAGRGGRLHVLNGDGTIYWTWDDPVAGQSMNGAPQAYDVDGDGFVEFFMNDGAGYVHCVGHDGELLWTSSRCGGANEGQTTVADIDRDGEYEVLWASQDYNVYCVEATTGNLKWNFNTGANMFANQVIVADVTGDGEYEALTWNDLGRVYCISPYGKEMWSWSPPQGLTTRIRFCQAIGDVDADGSLDMALMSDLAAYVIDIGGAVPKTKYMLNFTDMSLKGTLPSGAMMLAASSYQLIADIDGDGNQEILWLAPYPIVTDGATGTVEAYYLNDNVQVNARQENGGWWGDVDNDGRSEWIVELNGESQSQTQVYCLTLNGKFPANSPWPEYYHSAYPASYQRQQAWLTLKGACSNSLWFPMTEAVLQGLVAVSCLATLCKISRPPRALAHPQRQKSPDPPDI